MYKSVIVYLVIVSTIAATTNGSIIEKFQNYTKLFNFSPSDRNNELWYGIIRDCSKEVTFSCIQKNAYTYLDKTFIDRDNISVFDGLTLTRNNIDYNACFTNPKDDFVDGGCSETRAKNEDDNKIDDDKKPEKRNDEEEEEEEEYLTPLEEVTHALRKKALKFLATRDYEIQLPRFIAGGVGFKISPKEIDSRGALVRIDFDTRAVEEQDRGRLFVKHFLKKLKKELANKFLMTVFLLILLIKIIKLKFMFVLPFLFGIGTAKKLFLKLLLFFIPAFGHVFKLCSSYYSSHATKYHTHHHKIAHHHHHIPVPVPVYKPHSSGPIYYDHPPPSHSSHSSGPPGPGPIVLDEDFQGYDYAHPHIQYRKDIEELKEWGIEPYDENYDQIAPQAGVIHPGSPPKSTPKFPGPFAMPSPFASNAKLNFPDPKFPPPNHPQNLAYSGYPQPLPPPPPSRQPQGPIPAHSLPVSVVAGFGKAPVTQPTKQQNQQGYAGNSYQQQQQQRNPTQQQRFDQQQQASAPAAAVPVAVPPTRKPYDDEFYGPIIERLDEIFVQLRFLEENCRERLVCSMYKNPALYSPHSNLVSNELSRDAQELQLGNSASTSALRFHRYLNAARTGQDGGDCLKNFACSIRTE